MPDQALNKPFLLALIQARHARLLDVLGRLDDAQLAQPGAEGEWSAKDVLAHLAFWEQLVADELRQVARGETPIAIPGAEIQPLNTRTYQARRGFSRAELRAALDRSMETMLAAVSALSEADLASECTWTDEGSIAQHAANEMGHWEDHLDGIERWLARGNF